METLKFEQYLQEELQYYDEHPEEDDPIECHTNGIVCTEVEYKWQLINCPHLCCNSLHLPYLACGVCIIKEYKWISLMSETVRTLTITEAEETALVEIIRYFNDMGLPDNVDNDDYNSLTDKVCEPAFWEYN